MTAAPDGVPPQSAYVPGERGDAQHANRLPEAAQPGPFAPNLFVYACERSGSTLLCALLSEHPAIYVADDTQIFSVLNRINSSNVGWLLPKAAARVLGTMGLRTWSERSRLPPLNQKITKSDAECYYRALIGRYVRGPSNIWKPEYVARLDLLAQIERAREQRLSARELLGAAYLSLVPQEQRHKSVLGEKSPNHVYLSARIRQEYPDAREIILIRSPITNVAALYRRTHVRSLRHAINIYRSCYEDALGVTTGSDGAGLVIRYEDLVQQPIRTLAQTYRYLKVDEEATTTTFDYEPSKRHYIGTAIDPRRDQKLAALLDARERAIVLRSCDAICQRYYRELIP